VSKEKSLIKFSYKAFDDAGKKVSGTEMATSAGAHTWRCSPEGSSRLKLRPNRA